MSNLQETNALFSSWISIHRQREMNFSLYCFVGLLHVITGSFGFSFSPSFSISAYTLLQVCSTFFCAAGILAWNLLEVSCASEQLWMLFSSQQHFWQWGWIWNSSVLIPFSLPFHSSEVSFHCLTINRTLPHACSMMQLLDFLFCFSFSVFWTFGFLCPCWKVICDFCLCFSSLTAKRPLSQCLQRIGPILPVFSQNSAAFQIWFWGSLRAILCTFNQAHLWIICALILPSASTNMKCLHNSWMCTQATMCFSSQR